MNQWYFKLDVIKTEAVGAFKEYPVFYIFDENILDALKKLFIKACGLGFTGNLSTIQIGEQAVSIKGFIESLEELDSYEKISPEKLDFLLKIPHWSPVDEIIDRLHAFINNAEAFLEESEKFKDVLEDLLNQKN